MCYLLPVFSDDDFQMRVTKKTCITFPTFTNIVMDGIVNFTMMYKIKNSADRTSRVNFCFSKNIELRSFPSPG